MFLNKKYIMCGWVLLLALLSPLASAQAAENPFGKPTVMAPPAKPMKMPDFEFANLHGGMLNSSELKGKVIVIRFWATW